MLLVLSPSKTLDFDTKLPAIAHTQPMFLQEAAVLAAILKKYSASELAEFMEISDKLAALNVERFKHFSTPFTPDNARQALLAFKGDVYEGIEVENYTKAQFDFAQDHVRILSGLYGLLRPLDLIQPYRLEMGRPLKIGKATGLYPYWQDRISQALNDELSSHSSKILINLASEEYSKAMNRKALHFPVIDVIFKEKQGDKLKIIGLFAKKARGLMAHYIINNKLDTPDCLKNFTFNGYIFDKKSSNNESFIFIR